MSVKNIDPKTIKLPDMYVRAKGLNDDKVKEYARVIVDSDDGKGGWRWPFPALVIRKLKEPKGKKEWEVVDGAHRTAAAVGRRLETVPCEVREYATDGDAFLDQITLNQHGIGLSLDERDRAIRLLGSAEGPFSGQLTMDKIAKSCHLSPASVSRICNQKQRTGETGARAKAHRGKKRKQKGHETRRDGFSPLEYFTVCGNVVKVFRDHGDLVLMHKTEVSPESVANIINGFTLISQTLATGQLPVDFQSKDQRDAAKTSKERAAGVTF